MSPWTISIIGRRGERRAENVVRRRSRYESAKVAAGACRYTALRPPAGSRAACKSHVTPTALTTMSKLRNTLRGTSHARNAARALCGAAMLVVAVLAAACADAPVGPTQLAADAAPSLSKASVGTKLRFGPSDTLATPVVAQGLLRATPLNSAVNVTFE